MDESTVRKLTFTLDGGATSFLRHRMQLFAVAGPDVGQRWDLNASRITIGTAAGNEIVLNDRAASRHHCEIVAREPRYRIRDLGSTNGTFLGEVQIVEAFLEPGMQLRVGDTLLEFEPDARLTQIPPTHESRFGEMVGGSAAMRSVFGLLREIAPSPLTCLLSGETGTGKELAARALHASSGRSGPFVVVDCAALHGDLIESELFGHERGAFTGADRQRAGAFESAQGGTVFLDEVGELALDLQPRLLRVLERREVIRVGSNRPIDVDVRVLAATHRDLVSEVGQGGFREDLFYRIAEVVVELPPLRQRLDDLEQLCASLVGSKREVATDALEQLRAHSFPGNVRELRNILRRAAAFSSGPLISTDALSRALRHGTLAPTLPHADKPLAELHVELPLREARKFWLADLTSAYLEALFKRFDGDLDAVAAHAEVHRKSVQRLLRELSDSK